MPNYPLSGLKNIREQKKIAAENEFKTALRDLIREEEKLKAIDESIKKIKALKFAKNDSFYVSKPKHVWEVLGHAMIQKKILQEENEFAMKKARQLLVIKNSKDIYEKAHDMTKAAQKELKILDRHQIRFEQGIKRKRELKDNDILDEHANIKFIMRKKYNDCA